jgi:signal transduction histidine kinase
MANLLLHKGPGAGKSFRLEGPPMVIGRHPAATIRLDLPDVSRRHAQITVEQQQFFLEDLGSSNGTFLNGLPLKGKASLRPQDRIAIGPCEFVFDSEGEGEGEGETGVVIRAELSLRGGHADLLLQDPAAKLQAVLDIAHQLAQTLDLDVLLPRVLDHLLRLFPKADRGLVLLPEGERVAVRAVRCRRASHEAEQVFSRSVVQRVLAEGVGVLAADQGPAAGQTLVAAGIRSFVCVPLKARDGRLLGALQLDRSAHGGEFTAEDLHLLTAVSLPISAVLENAALHAELMRQELVKRDLALARLAQLAAGVAHEINNPLAFVSTNTVVFQRDVGALRRLLELYQQAEAALEAERPAPIAEARALAEEIDLAYTLKNLDDLLGRSREGLKRIAQIVKGLRDFARLDESERDEVDLNAGVESAVGIARGLAEKRQVHLSLELGELPRLSCHPSKVNQVVFNLLSNAIDACEPGGSVRIRTCACAGGVEVHVQDTGHGIDPAVRERIFDPFFTTKPLGKGVGLGLSISHGIVQDHGGSIEVQSRPGEGAHFVVRLPCSRDKVTR